MREKHHWPAWIRAGWLVILSLLLNQGTCAYLSKAMAHDVHSVDRPTLELIQPRPGAAISGSCALRLAIQPRTAFSKIALYIGAHLLGATSSSVPYILWNTGSVGDGSYCIVAVGQNKRGETIARYHTIITVNNHRNSLRMVSPNPDILMSGVQELRIRGVDSLYYPALWQVEVDGEVAGNAYTDNAAKHDNSVTVELNTTKYANGPHDLYIGMSSDYWHGENTLANKKSYNWRGGFERIVNFDNGRSLMDIEPNYLHVYLQPGESSALGCRARFTDQSVSECPSPTYASSDSRVARSSTNGTVTGGHQGFASVTVTDGTHSGEAYVWVRHEGNTPHFSGDGQMLTSYEPGRSIFIIAPFELEAAELRDDRQLFQDVKSAGVNTISQGFYQNPRDVSISFRRWQSSYDSQYLTAWQFAEQHGLHILATGDEICRRIGGEAWWTLNWPYGKRAVQYAVEQLAASHVALAIDMVDEASMLWGPTPRPIGSIGKPQSFQRIICSKGICQVDWRDNPFSKSGRPGGNGFVIKGSSDSRLNTPAGVLYRATRINALAFQFRLPESVNKTFTRDNDPNLEFLWWSGDIDGCLTAPCSPPVPNDTLTRITGWLRSARPNVPISWPAVSVSTPEIQGNWMGPGSISDYASHYWTSYNERPAFYWSSGVQEESYWIRRAFYQRQPFMQLDKPQLMEVSVSGPSYAKHSENEAYYSPLVDTLDQPGVTAPVIVAEMMTEAALGVAGERLYYFEKPSNESERARAKLGSYFQTGVDPEAHDDTVQRNWRAVSSAAQALTGILEPYILASEVSSPSLGRNIVTAVRHSSRGTLLLIVNDNDWERIIPVDFKPYLRRSKPVRFIISADGIRGPVQVSADSEGLRLEAGESAAYLFNSK